jgi:hypothetical protein
MNLYFRHGNGWQKSMIRFQRVMQNRIKSAFVIGRAVGDRRANYFNDRSQLLMLENRLLLAIGGLLLAKTSDEVWHRTAEIRTVVSHSKFLGASLPGLVVTMESAPAVGLI